MPRKKVSGTPSKARVLAALINKVNKSAGHPVIQYADQVSNPYLLRRPSGIMQLDIDMAGGAPAGGMIKLTGPENAGKTYLLYLYMAMHQRIYGEDSVLGLGYTEWIPDHFHMRMAGMQVAIPDESIDRKDAARIRAGLPPFTKAERAEFKKQVGRIVFLHGDTGEDLLQNMLDLIDKNVCGIVGLDSMTMIMPSDEATKDMDDSFNVRARAQLLTNFQTKIHYVMNRGGNETTLILIDQVRANPDKALARGPMARFVKAYKHSDIYAARHGAMMTVMLTEGARNKATSGANKGLVLGKQLNWSLEKGSKGTHNNISGSTYYDYNSGVDLVKSIIVSGLRHGTIKQSDSDSVTVFDATGQPVLENVDDVNALEEIVRNDFELERDIRQFILEKNGIPCVYD